jgi:hypothetical protein
MSGPPRTRPIGAIAFAALNWKLGRGGPPLLIDALAGIEFEIVAEPPATGGCSAESTRCASERSKTSSSVCVESGPAR